MSECDRIHEQLPEDCREAFKVLFRKLDSIDVAIRGNGKPGLNQRVSTLEEKTKTSSKLILFLAGSGITVLAAVFGALAQRFLL